MDFLLAQDDVQPVSPNGYYLNSSVCSPVVLGVLESEVAIDDSQTMSLLKHVFLPINPRFSSIMVQDQTGIKVWKKVELLNLEEHVKIPIYPNDMPLEFYDKCLDDYLSTIAQEKLPQSRPLWEIHIFKYPTSNASGNLIFKIHHSIGDGYSLVAALFSCLKRADNPSLPLTSPFIQLRPTSQGEVNGIFKCLPVMTTVYNTIIDFVGSFLKRSLLKDMISPIRSGVEGVEFLPMSITTMTFSLEEIKQIKASLGMTINDVITGIIFMGVRSYMQEMNPESTNFQSTATILLNTRMLRSYTSIQDMIKPDTKSPWGNHFAFLDVSIPKLTDIEFGRPLELLRRIHETMKRKRNSSTVYLNAWLLDTINKFRGPEVAAKCIYNTLKNTSMTITNLIGPMEQMALANHPIKGLYFMLAGSPQSLIIGVITYMGQLRVSIGVQKDYIDVLKLKACIKDAFEVMHKAACNNYQQR